MPSYEFYTEDPRAGLKLDAYLPFLEREFQLQIIPEGRDGQPTEHQLGVLASLLALDSSFVDRLNETGLTYLNSLGNSSVPLTISCDEHYQVYGVQVFGWQNPPTRSFGVFAFCDYDPTDHIEWIVQNETPVFCGPNDFHWGDAKPEAIEILRNDFAKLKKG